ncbi:MAG: hypothetical protein JWM11_1485, partial [Planctomycetaceae bacterium]|nr:hypothetical protein [Planctomycetaceae bacterium]
MSGCVATKINLEVHDVAARLV